MNQFSPNHSGQASLTSMIAAILLITVMGVAGLLFYKLYLFENMSSVERLNILWKQDMSILNSSRHLHPGWRSIKQFEAYGGSKKAQSWLSELRVPVQKKDQGLYKLEILILEFDQDDVEHAIVQLNLVELKSQNMIWEFARTYKLNSYFDHLSREFETILSQKKAGQVVPKKIRKKGPKKELPNTLKNKSS